MHTNVYITIDTENSMGGAWDDPILQPVGSDRRIYCYINGKSYGIGWICEELNARKLKATFFAEVFGSLVFGKDETREWFQYLLDQGQDVQLHTHLNFYFFSQRVASGQNGAYRSDNLTDIKGPLRDELLEQACEIFRQMAGYNPIAYRAGNWCIDRALLKDLSAKGIIIDASYNQAFRDSRSLGDGLDLVNGLHMVDRIWEMPVAVTRQYLPIATIDELRPLDPVSLSCWELRKALDDYHTSGASHVSISFHSFSGVKPKDRQYTETKPDRVVRRRFKFLLDYLSENRDRFRVSTFSELAGQLQSGDVGKRHASIPRLGFFHPLARNVVQAVNSIYY